MEWLFSDKAYSTKSHFAIRRKVRKSSKELNEFIASEPGFTYVDNWAISRRPAVGKDLAKLDDAGITPNLFEDRVRLVLGINAYQWLEYTK